MMKNVSVLALLVRNNFYKVLFILGAMALVEAFKFYRFLSGDRVAVMNVEQMFDEHYIMDYFRIALAAVFLVLCVTENRLEKNSNNTLMRLRISTKELFVIRTLYNVFVIALLFVVQIWTSIIIINVYIGYIGEDILGPQQLFLAFYRSEALHNILPMAEVSKWIRNILLVVAYAMQAAVCGKKNYVMDIWICIFFYMFIVSEIGLNIVDMLADIIAAVVIASVLFKAGAAFIEERRGSESYE